ncbi:MAG: translation initiation factor IF-2 [Candidatus Aenigmatarchaeota archaeon]
MELRAPIVTLMGHVDHGKTSLADAIRNSLVALKEPGQITQHISSTFIPKNVIEKICGDLLKKFKFEIKFNGILLIDTPGHAAFSHLRKRGGSISDIAILVIDIIEGIEEQTIECLEILKNYKIPFLIALNKIDKLPNWKNSNSLSFLESVLFQSQQTIFELDKKLYEIVAKLYEFNFISERFDRITDFKSQIPIVPVSAKTKEGLAELLLIISGLSQIFLKDRLYISQETKGIILELREQKGLGIVADCILYDGKLKKGDSIVIASHEPIITKIKFIMVPKELKDIRYEKEFEYVNEIVASAGIRIFADNLENVIAGSEFRVIKDEKEIEKLKNELKMSFENIIFKKELDGIIVKADTLGSLEAIINMLEKEKIPIKKTGVGKLKKEDIIDLDLIRDEKYKILVLFNVQISEEERETLNQKNVKIIEGNVIYRIVEEIKNYLEEKKRNEAKYELSKINRPVIIKVLKGFIFRRSNPAIFGVEILKGRLFKGVKLKREDGKEVGIVNDIQKENRSIEFATKNEKVAISIENAIIGRTFEEDDILVSDISQKDLEILKKYFDYLSEEEKELLKEWKLV